MKIDRYYWRAQYLPALLSSIPVMMFFDIYLAHLNWWKPSAEVMNLGKIPSAAIGTGISFLLIQINAFLSKEIYQPTSENLPSTKLLLFSDQKLSKQIKKELHQRIFADFGVRLVSEKQEANDPTEAKKTIASAVARMREKMRSQPFVYRRLTSYGFVRNLAGGSILAACMLMILGIYQFTFNESQLKVTLVLFIVYVLFALVAPLIIRRSGQEYAETLIDQYLAMPQMNGKTA